MTRSLELVAALLTLAVIAAAAQDKPATPLRNFTTLPVEDVRIAPELAHLDLQVSSGKPLGTTSDSEATEAIRRNILEEVMGQHMFRRVTDVEKPETVTPQTEPEDVQVAPRRFWQRSNGDEPELTYGEGLDHRYRRRADVEDAKVAKPAAERILLLRCEIVEHRPPVKRKPNLLTGNLGHMGDLEDQVTARCQLVDKAEGSVMSQFQARSAVHLRQISLFYDISCAEAQKHPEKYILSDKPSRGDTCYTVLDTMDEAFPTRLGYEVAKAIKRNW